MIVGITGTRYGLTKVQLNCFLAWEIEHLCNVSEIHHGDCKGADEDISYLLSKLYPDAKLYIHPPVNNKYRAFTAGDVFYPEKPYLIRNQAIVNCSELMLAFPGQDHEILRSGTWATIRYAKKSEKSICIFTPTGEIHEF
jgi:hypothetical protein